MLLSVRCGLSCSSAVVCGVYVGVLMWAFVSVLLQFVGLGEFQLHYILACHYELHFVMLLFISDVCLRYSGASLGLSVSSARILPMLFVCWHNCILALVVALLRLIAYQRGVMVFALVWSPGMRYVERIAVVALDPVSVFVGVCWFVACMFLFVVVGCARVGCVAGLVAANVSTRRRLVRLHLC